MVDQLYLLRDDVFFLRYDVFFFKSVHSICQSHSAGLRCAPQQQRKKDPIAATTTMVFLSFWIPLSIIQRMNATELLLEEKKDIFDVDLNDGAAEDVTVEAKKKN